jgi:general secretion pathway protein K
MFQICPIGSKCRQSIDPAASVLVMNERTKNLEPPPTGSDGFIVVAILWILGALGALVSIYAVYVINSATAFSAYDDHLRAEALASAAIELASYQVQSKPGAPATTHGDFKFRLGQANVTVDFHSESSRVDLNAAPKPLLAGLFRVVGASADNADAYAEMVIAWRTAANVKIGNAGTHPASPADLPAFSFAQPAELSLVSGLPPTLVEKVLPFVTVYSGRPQVNALDAPPEVITALPGLTPERSNRFLAQRRESPENPQALLPLLSEASQFLTTESSKAIRVRIRVNFDNGRQEGSEVVILVFDEGEQPFAVLSWQTAFDGTATTLRTEMR